MPPSYTRGPYDPLDRRPSYSGSCHRLKFEGLKGRKDLREVFSRQRDA
jgi:hypothetical protein